MSQPTNQTKQRRAKSQSSAPKKLLSIIEGWDYLGRPFGVNRMYEAVKPGGAFSPAVVQIAERNFLSRAALDKIIEQGAGRPVEATGK